MGLIFFYLVIFLWINSIKLQNINKLLYKITDTFLKNLVLYETVVNI